MAKTLNGKARSALNALKHGFRSKSLIIPIGMEDEFQDLDLSLRSEIKPSGECEEMIFTQLLRAAWDLRRIEYKLASLAEDGIDPFDDPEKLKQYDLFQRYHNRAEVSLYRAQRELRTLQTNRILQQAIPAPLDLGTLPRLAGASQIVSLAKRTHKHFNSIAMNQLIHTSPKQPPEPSSFTGLLTPEERSKFQPKPRKIA